MAATVKRNKLPTRNWSKAFTFPTFKEKATYVDLWTSKRSICTVSQIAVIGEISYTLTSISLKGVVETAWRGHVTFYPLKFVRLVVGQMYNLEKSSPPSQTVRWKSWTKERPESNVNQNINNVGCCLGVAFVIDDISFIVRLGQYTTKPHMCTMDSALFGSSTQIGSTTRSHFRGTFDNGVVRDSSCKETRRICPKATNVCF